MLGPNGWILSFKGAWTYFRWIVIHTCQVRRWVSHRHMVCSCILGDGFPIMILGYTGWTVISETHHFECHIWINFCFYICKIQQKTSKQVAKGSTSPQKKHRKIDTNHFSPNNFFPSKTKTPTTTAPHLAIPTWSCAQRAWLVPSVLWSLQIWDQTLHRRLRDLESYDQRRRPCEFEATSGGRDGWRWLTTLPDTNSKFAPKNGWLEYDPFLLEWPFFQVRTVSFRECSWWLSFNPSVKLGSSSPRFGVTQ